jgi:hypothetical protein
MLFISSTPELIRHLWQLKTVVFLHWCRKCAVILKVLVKYLASLKVKKSGGKLSYVISSTNAKIITIANDASTVIISGATIWSVT